MCAVSLGDEDVVEHVQIELEVKTEKPKAEVDLRVVQVASVILDDVVVQCRARVENRNLGAESRKPKS